MIRECGCVCPDPELENALTKRLLKLCDDWTTSAHMISSDRKKDIEPFLAWMKRVSRLYADWEIYAQDMTAGVVKEDVEHFIDGARVILEKWKEAVAPQY